MRHRWEKWNVYIALTGTVRSLSCPLSSFCLFFFFFSCFHISHSRLHLCEKKQAGQHSEAEPAEGTESGPAKSSE